MITAEKARILTDQNNPIKKNVSNLLYIIENKIKDACTDGEDHVEINLNDSKYIRYLEQTAIELVEQGFTVSTKKGNWRNEEYATLYISW